MSVVTLVSGGLDSTIMALLAREASVEQFPLFINYGQRSLSHELAACRQSMARYALPAVEVATLPGFGQLIPSGLTDQNLRVYEDAFLPCRNLFFLVVGAAYAVRRGASSVAIGLLDERASLFPDQTRAFLLTAEEAISKSVGLRISAVAPLIDFTKADVVRLATEKGVEGTYSCHLGGDEPCGGCVACREYIGTGG